MVKAFVGLAVVVAITTVALLLVLKSPGDDSDELKQESQQLFDAFALATSEGDVGAFYELLAPDITGRCTLDQLEGSFGDEDSGFGLESIEVAEVFLSVNDANRAYVRLELMDDSEAAPDIGLTAFPFPIVRDEGRWLLSFPYLAEGDACPFEGETEPADRSVNAEPIGPPVPIGLGVDFDGLTPPPGSTSHGGGWGGGSGQFEASILLETETTAADLLQHYRSELAKPEWIFQSEYQDADTAWAIWSIKDESDQLWMAVLFAGNGEEGLRKVYFWAVTGASVDVLRGSNFEPRVEPAQPPVPGP